MIIFKLSYGLFSVKKYFHSRGFRQISQSSYLQRYFNRLKIDIRLLIKLNLKFKFQ